MKKIFRLFLMLTAVAFSTSSLTSCSDDLEEPYINIQQKEFRVNSVGEKVAVPIESNGRWQIISPVPEWVTIENAVGSGTSELIIDVASNSSFERSCNLVLAANVKIETIKLTQSASTSGKLSVSTGSCTVDGWLGHYTLTFSFTVINPHLASRAGIIYNGQQYQCSELGSYCTVQISANSLNPYGGSYQAYAIDKSTGKYVYGSTKTINK